MLEGITKNHNLPQAKSNTMNVYESDGMNALNFFKYIEPYYFEYDIFFDSFKVKQKFNINYQNLKNEKKNIFRALIGLSLYHKYGLEKAKIIKLDVIDVISRLSVNDKNKEKLFFLIGGYIREEQKKK